jgi:ABC-type nitrate/sulfonate/bicarbonate transport system substrate-binding protein
MRAGAVDIGYAGETPPVFAQAGGVPFLYVALDPPAPQAEAIVVRKDSALHTLADLKGKRVALNRGEFGEREPALLRTVLDEYRSLSEWAAGHAEEASRLSADSSGIAYDALLPAERRHAYGLRPITPEILHKQQTIADAFQRLQLIPTPIRTEQAFLPLAAYTASR